MFKIKPIPLDRIKVCHPDFWDRVNKRGELQEGCWEWTGKRVDFGYGYISISMNGKSKTYTTHRVAYYWHYGVDPESLLVCHKCDNPPCINPLHLFLGTHTDNNRDMAAKKRNVSSPKRKIDEITVQRIVNEYKEGFKQWQIALKYGLNQGTISRIIRGERWVRSKVERLPLEFHHQRRGEQHPQAIFTDDEVLAIFELRKELTSVEIAQKFNKPHRSIINVLMNSKRDICRKLRQEYRGKTVPDPLLDYRRRRRIQQSTQAAQQQTVSIDLPINAK